MKLGSKRNEWEQKPGNFQNDRNQCFFGMIAIFDCHNKSIKNNTVVPMFAGFNLHKRHKLRLREQFLLTKRHQCISLMELGSEEIKNKRQETSESISHNAVSRLFAVYECHTKETKKLQEILLTERRETTRLMQLGGKYFEWKQFGTFVFRSSEGSYSNVSRLQLAQKVEQNEDTRKRKFKVDFNQCR